jgi:serine/threonine protein kinase
VLLAQGQPAQPRPQPSRPEVIQPPPTTSQPREQPTDWTKYIFIGFGVLAGIVVIVVYLNQQKSGLGGSSKVKVTETQIDGYRLLNLMMTGQTSQVWQTAEVSSGRHFAIKFLLPEHVRNTEHRFYLYHEAEVGLTLAHEKVIRILKLIRDRLHPYMVMEFFPSKNLKLRLVHKDDILGEQIRSILEQAAVGLAHINDKGWVHRDVKPDNILVNSAGEVRIIDFALAQRIVRKKSFLDLFRRKGKTQGTRSYMSPEQIRGEPLDERADIYSFGATMFELLAGRPPFVAGTAGELLNKHLAEKPPSPKNYERRTLEIHKAPLTDEATDLIMRMLSKKKQDRPRDFPTFLSTFRSLKLFGERKVFGE